MTAATETLAPPKRSNLVLWILVAVCAFPYLLSWAYFQFRDVLPAPKTSNYGTLVSPVRALGDLPLQGLDGTTFNLADLHGKWVLLSVGNSACAVACQKNLYFLRQVRQAMGNERRRVERLFVLTDTRQLPAFQARLQGHEGLKVAVGPQATITQLQAVLRNPNPVAEDGWYIVDPLGNVMMSYPPDFNGELMIKDLRRLLAVSQVG
jgi:hypothetical protein